MSHQSECGPESSSNLAAYVLIHASCDSERGIPEILALAMASYNGLSHVRSAESIGIRYTILFCDVIIE
jgi:hypothetical protein